MDPFVGCFFFPSRHCMWCCVCLLPLHRTEYFLIHLREGTPLQYSSGFRPCCNGSRLHSIRRWWDRLCTLHLLGERGCWTYAPCFDFLGESSMGSGVRCRSSYCEIIGEITRLTWDWSRRCLRCWDRSCILSLCWFYLLRGQCAYLICLLWHGWFPARCCPGCFPFPSMFLVCPPLMGMIRCSGRVGRTYNR